MCRIVPELGAAPLPRVLPAVQFKAGAAAARRRYLVNLAELQLFVEQACPRAVGPRVPACAGPVTGPPSRVHRL